MPRLNKVRKSCKNAHLAKISKPSILVKTSNPTNQQQIPTFQLITTESNSFNLLEIEEVDNQQQISTAQLTILRIKKDLIAKINYLSEKRTNSWFS
ncbi:7208_t:CDS:1, partial [Racocetra fulgida]